MWFEHTVRETALLFLEKNLAQGIVDQEILNLFHSVKPLGVQILQLI